MHITTGSRAKMVSDMHPRTIDFLINLAASAVFTICLVFFGWALIAIRRKPLLHFFGIVDTRHLRVYTSHVRVDPKSPFTLAVDGSLRSFAGSSVPIGEMGLLEDFYSLFSSVSLTAGADIPGELGNILFSDIRIESMPSPLSIDQIDTTNSVISFGSPAYNRVSEWIETELHSIGRFTDDLQPKIAIPNLDPFSDPLIGFIQRTRISDRFSLAFYCAGPSEQATRAAMHFLLSRCEYLYKRFGHRENFIVILKADAQDHRKHNLLLERGEYIRQ